MDINDYQARVRAVVRDGSLGYGQKVRKLASLATDALPYPEVSDACRRALDDRVICDLYEGHAPYTPRYVLPDYGRALRQGAMHLELPPPADLADAIAFLQIMYAHVPSVTTYPVYLGDIDTLLEPFVPASMSDDDLDRTMWRFWMGIDRMQPDAFAHLDVGPDDGRVVRSIFRVDRALRQPVPNITLKVDPSRTSDDLIEDGVRTVFATGKPHFVNHPMMVADHGDGYAAVSCYNALKIGGGAHTLVRLNLHEVARRHKGGPEHFFASTLPAYVALTAELIEARVRSLVEDQRFFETHWLAREGLVRLERFTAMFGIFGLAECVEAMTGRQYGHDDRADEFSRRVVARVAELVAARPMPYCEGSGGHCSLHSQGGIDLDDHVTAGTRIPVGTEPSLVRHIATCAPHHRYFDAGVSDIMHVDLTAERHPDAMVDVIRGAFATGMRDFTFNLDDNEFVRITGYLVRKSDLARLAAGEAVLHSSDHLAKGSEDTFHLTERAVNQVGVW